jgi:hypothetical protein
MKPARALSPMEALIFGEGFGSEWDFAYDGGSFKVEFKGDGFNHFRRNRRDRRPERIATLTTRASGARNTLRIRTGALRVRTASLWTGVNSASTSCRWTLPPR